jgi:hypothetical protein
MGVVTWIEWRLRFGFVWVSGSTDWSPFFLFSTIVFRSGSKLGVGLGVFLVLRLGCKMGEFGGGVRELLGGACAALDFECSMVLDLVTIVGVGVVMGIAACDWWFGV